MECDTKRRMAVPTLKELLQMMISELVVQENCPCLRTDLDVTRLHVMLDQGAWGTESQALLDRVLVRFPHLVTYRVLRALLPTCTTKISLARCIQLKESCVNYILDTCVQLQSLDLAGNSNLGFGEINLFKKQDRSLYERLKHVSVKSCQITDENVQSLLMSAPHLQSLNISWTAVTDKVFLLNEVKQLAREGGFDHPSLVSGYDCQLQMVDLTGCSDITSTGVRHLCTLTGPTLQAVELSHTRVDSTCLLYLSGLGLPAVVQFHLAEGQEDTKTHQSSKQRIAAQTRRETLLMALEQFELISAQMRQEEMSIDKDSSVAEKLDKPVQSNVGDGEERCVLNNMQADSDNQRTGITDQFEDNFSKVHMSNVHTTPPYAAACVDYISESSQSYQQSYSTVDTNCFMGINSAVSLPLHEDAPIASVYQQPKISNHTIEEGLSSDSVCIEVFEQQPDSLNNIEGHFKLTPQEKDNIFSSVKKYPGEISSRHLKIAENVGSKSTNNNLLIADAKESQSQSTKTSEQLVSSLSNEQLLIKSTDGFNSSHLEAEVQSEEFMQTKTLGTPNNLTPHSFISSLVPSRLDSSPAASTETVCSNHSSTIPASVVMHANTGSNVCSPSSTLSVNSLKSSFGVQNISMTPKAVSHTDLNETPLKAAKQSVPEQTIAIAENCNKNITSVGGSSSSVKINSVSSSKTTGEVAVILTDENSERPYIPAHMKLDTNTTSDISVKTVDEADHTSSICMNSTKPLDNRNSTIITKTSDVNSDTTVTDVKDNLTPSYKKHNFTVTKENTISAYYSPNIKETCLGSAVFADVPASHSSLSYFLSSNPNLTSLSILGGHAGMNGQLITDEVLQQVTGSLSCPGAPSLRHLTLEGCILLTTAAVARLRACSKLEHLDLTGVSFVEDAGLNILAKSLPLSEFHLAETRVGNETLLTLAEHPDVISKLQALDLSWCEDLEDDVGMTAVTSKCHNLRQFVLRESPISEATIKGLAINCRHLTKLGVSCNPSVIVDDALFLLAENLLLLETVDLSWNSNLTDASITALLTNCRWLQKANLGGLKRLTAAPFSPIVYVPKILKDYLDRINKQTGDRDIINIISEGPCLPRRSKTYATALMELELQYSDFVQDDILEAVVAVTQGSIRIVNYYGEEVEANNNAMEQVINNILDGACNT